MKDERRVASHQITSHNITSHTPQTTSPLLPSAPMSSSKLWMSARAQSGASGMKGLNTPYVVKFHNHFPVADAKALFRFDHPNMQTPELIDNSR